MTLGGGWGEGEMRGIALCKIFIKLKMNQIGAKVGNNEVLKTFKKTFKFQVWLIVLGFYDMSTHVGNFVSSPREREKRDRRDSRGDEREGQERKRNRNESEETEEIKTFPLYPYLLQG